MKRAKWNKWLSVLLSASMVLGAVSVPAFAAEADADEGYYEMAEEADEEELSDEEEAEAAESPETNAAAELVTEEAEDSEMDDTEAEVFEEAEAEADAEIEYAEEVAAGDEAVHFDAAYDEEEQEGEEETTVAEEMVLASVGGINYYYADTEGDDEATVYQAVVTSRKGSTTYSYGKSELTQLGETSLYYINAPGTTALEGTLYGYGEGTATNYKEVYAGLGVGTDNDSAYDAVSSATAFTGHHAKDIPSLVTYGTDAEGNKVITGLTLGRSAQTVDALTYVEASILSAAGSELSEDQEAALAVTLKTNPMSAPADAEVEVKLASAAFTTSKYGVGEFAINPDDTVEGYVWSEYWNSVYAVTVSDGTDTVGAVHWIDMYGEAAVSGPHYNKLEIALNNGTSVGSNAAEVSRYAAFFDGNTGNVKPGTYTIMVYAEGYSTLTAVVEIPAEEMSSVSIGGVTYFYADTEGDDASTVYQAVVSSRKGSTTYNYAKSDLTQVGDTNLYYVNAFGTAALEGTLYGYGEGTATNYKEVYAGLGVGTDNDSAYDAVSSATAFTGHHAKDIPSLVTYGTDAEGNKAITGLALGREKKTVDAVTYVEASILSAAGSELSEDREAALAVTLKTNPMSAPADAEVEVKLASAAFTTSKYGVGEFAINPDDTAEGYVWSEYWNSVYAVTVSDGTDTVGAVHWIDMYGEAAVSGPHYNKLEIALNNGTSVGSNKAEVSRYAAFFDGDEVRTGTYTITVYAEGYSTLTAQVDVVSKKDAAKALIEAANGTFDTAEEAQAAVDAAKAAYDALTDEQKAALGTEAETALSTAQDKADAQKAAEEKAAEEQKTTEETEEPQKEAAKGKSAVTLKAKSATYTGKAIAIGAATVKGSTGKVTYTYYSDSACTKKLSGAPANAGTYYVKASVAADSKYEAATSAAVKLTIKKAAQKITIKKKSKTYKVKKVNAKKQTFSIGAKASGKGKLTYKKTSGKKYFTVDKKTGKITVKKGTKKGTYTIKVKIKAAATANYKAKTVTKKITIKIK